MGLQNINIIAVNEQALGQALLVDNSWHFGEWVIDSCEDFFLIKEGWGLSKSPEEVIIEGLIEDHKYVGIYKRVSDNGYTI